MTATGDYTQQIHISATPEKVFGTLTTTAKFASWWAPATGSAAEAGELRITFEGIEDPLMLRVRQATHPSTVTWDVESCTFLPDWVGTTPAFTLTRSGADGCDVEFRHQGLSPQLECYDMCRAGWDQYLPSLRDYLQTGTGNPYTPARQG
jgi:uncharacterized protein YndB with AHSA1/START domain